MATEFSQDALLFFLQRQGGTVKNSDLILHFKDFIRDHPDRDRNRQFFKKFVNSVATVKQVDGVAYVTLKRQFRGYVPGGGAEVGSSDPPWVPVGKKTENAALNEPRQKLEHKEASTPAPPGETGMKTILPAAGILLSNNNNVEENFNRKQQQVNSTPGQVLRTVTAQAAGHIPQKPELNTPSLSKPPASDQASKGGQQRVGYGPLPGVTPAPPHRATSPGPEALRRRSQPEEGLHQAAPAHSQLAIRRVKQRQSYKTAVSVDEDEEEEEVTVMQGSAGGARPPNAPLSDTVRVTPAPSSVQRSYIQDTEGDMPTPRGPAGVSLNNSSSMAANLSLKQQQVNSTPGQVLRPVTAQAVSHIPLKPELSTPSPSTPPVSDQASKGGQQRVGYGPLPGVTLAPPHRETSPGPEALRRRCQPEEGLHQEAPAHSQLIQRGAKHRQSYKTAVSVDEDEEEEFPMRRSSAVGARPPNAPLSDTVRVTPAPSSVQRSYIQGTEGDMPTPRGPAGVSLNNSSSIAANFNRKQQQVNSTPGQVLRPVTAQVVSHIPQKPELNTPSLSTPPVSDQASKGGQQRVGYGALPGVTPAPPHRETSPGPEALRRRSQPEEGLHQEAPAHSQLIQRGAKHRQSYKTAVSVDEDEEEEFPMRRSSAGGAWPLNAPLGDTARAMSSSTPCIIDVPAPPTVPQICIQDAEGETLTPRHAGLAGLRMGPAEATKRSLPLQTALHHNIRQDHQYSPPAREPRQGSNQSFSTRASGWTSSSGDLQIRAGEPVGKIQKTVQQTRETAPESVTSRADRKSTLPWHRSTGQLYDEQEASARSSPLHRSTDQLHEDQGSAARVMPWHLSTGDLDEVEASDSSISPPYIRHCAGVADQFSGKQRMCRSLGDDLDQINQEDERGERGGGNEMARRSRLYRISSSLSLHHNLSCSSLSSCSTPPRCPSIASLDDLAVQKGDKVNVSTEASPSSTHRDGRSRHSLVPLESREHAWMIKGAAGNWTDIYTLFREDPSLLNKKDFIYGFTVMHWIAKHGDHRVLNTLGYGAEKLSLALDINARANSGHTPLHLAVMHGHKNLIRLLVKKYQADVKQRDVAGKRPWQYLSGDAPLEMFHVLGAPLQNVMGKKSLGVANSSWEQQQQQQRESRRLRHHASSASGQRPLTVLDTVKVKVKRSTSLAAFLKHKSLQKFHAQQVDTSV